MKQSLCILLCLLLQLMSVHAESYVVLSGANNTIVEKKSKDERQSVASISKIMTAVIAVEHEQLDEPFTVNDEVNKTHGSGAYLKQRQQVTMRDLLYGLMLRSDNDAAVGIAEHAAGFQEAFIELMNHKAAEIGTNNMTFSSPSGLDKEDGGNISTANDMAVLVSYAMKNKEFRAITGSKYYTADWNMRWKNKNRLLSDYPFTVDGKTGFTKKADRTLVNAAGHDGMESIVVTLREGDDFALHGQKRTEVSQKVDVVMIIRKSDYTIDGRKFHIPETLKVTLYKDGSDRPHVKTHYGHKGFVVGV